MRIAVLGATGATGQQLVAQALARQHDVVALARNPDRISIERGTSLRAVAADVSAPETVISALSQVDAVVSGLGVAKGDPPTTLTAGARALADAIRQSQTDLRVIWLGALGTGGSAPAAGPLGRGILKLALGKEIADKTGADNLLLSLGATVFHAGPLTNGALSPTRHTVTIEQAPRRWFPRPVARATVAVLMIDEAERQAHVGAIVLPLP